MVRTADILYHPDPSLGDPSIRPPANCTVRAICAPSACPRATIRTASASAFCFTTLRVAEEMFATLLQSRRQSVWSDETNINALTSI